MTVTEAAVAAKRAELIDDVEAQRCRVEAIRDQLDDAEAELRHTERLLHVFDDACTVARASGHIVAGDTAVAPVTGDTPPG